MALSGSTDFNPDVSDLIEEAFELCGLEARTGNDIRSARRSLNYLMLEWQNKGINLWTVDEQTITSATIAAGTATYDIDVDTISILDAVIRTDAGDTSLQSDVVINRISETTYSQIPAKLQTGRPVQFYFDRIGVKDIAASTDRPATVTFWPVPDLSNKYTFVYWRMRRMQDTGTGALNTMEVPERFLPSLVYGLAAKLSFKKAIDRFQFLEGKYNELFKEAAEEDRSKEDFRIVPQLDMYSH
jgi:hypothetical protein